MTAATSSPGNDTTQQPRFRRLLLASSGANLADGLLLVLLPILAVRITTSPTAIAGVALASRSPWLVMSLFAGAFSDRVDRRRLMVSANQTRVLVLVVFGGLTLTNLLELWHLYATAFVLGVAETFADTAAQSFVPNVVASDDLSKANSRLYFVETLLNQFVGRPLAGLVAGAFAAGATVALFGTSGLYAAAVLLLLGIPGSYPAASTAKDSSIVADVREGFSYVWDNRVLRALAILTGLLNLAIAIRVSLFPLLVLDEMGLPEFGFGLLMTGSAAGALVGSAMEPRFEARFGRRVTLGTGLVGIAISLAVPGLTLNPVAVFAAAVIFGVAMIFWNVVTVSLRQRIAPDFVLGRVNASYRFLGSGVFPVGAGLAAFLGEITSVQTAFLVAGALAAVQSVRLRSLSEADLGGG